MATWISSVNCLFLSFVHFLYSGVFFLLIFDVSVLLATKLLFSYVPSALQVVYGKSVELGCLFHFQVLMGSFIL